MVTVAFHDFSGFKRINEGFSPLYQRLLPIRALLRSLFHGFHPVLHYPVSVKMLVTSFHYARIPLKVFNIQFSEKEGIRHEHSV